MNAQLTDLTQTLSEYSNVANDSMLLVSKALRPIALILVMIFFLIELNNWKDVLEVNGKQLTTKIWANIAMKYLVAVVLILGSDYLADFILEIGNILTKVVANAVPLTTSFYQFDAGDVQGVIETMIVNMIGSVVQFIANFMFFIVLFLRYLDLYILKGISPILLAFFISSTFRPASLNFIKSYIAYALVGVLLLIVSVVYGAFINADVFATFTADSGNFGSAIASIAKGVIYILTIVGITRKAKSMIGVS